jgi:uncharacterized damage-inducible protein DinB
MKNEVVKGFIHERNELIGIIRDLSEEELNRVPFEKSWTAAQVGDHLLKSYGLFKIFTGNVKTADRPENEKIKPIEKVFLNFDIKLNAPDFIIPSDGFINKETLLSQLNSITSQIINFSENNDLSLLFLDFEFPGSGTLTRLELLSFFIVHTKRHIHQLKKIVKALHQI